MVNVSEVVNIQQGPSSAEPVVTGLPQGSEREASQAANIFVATSKRFMIGDAYLTLRNNQPEVSVAAAQNVFSLPDFPDAYKISLARFALKDGNEGVVKAAAEWLNGRSESCDNLGRIVPLSGVALFSSFGRFTEVEGCLASMMLSGTIAEPSRKEIIVEFSSLLSSDKKSEVLRGLVKNEKDSSLASAFIAECVSDKYVHKELIGAIRDLLGWPDLPYRETVELCSSYLKLNPETGASDIKSWIGSKLGSEDQMLAAVAAMEKYGQES